ncbi:MAG TPA: ParA family protein [bacterium]|uniref:Sporulation initiation inhibitor protein Soj n=1 Tax=candidate division TA06 bacterium ADurb.Bin417 TaxID=1852828 RepID=A0A1V5MGM9_UNCT6|nr:MAG: Sporulation initiation inhibitor protein Soj [candidate division TA06 bacterium ADurb.Bin417]HNQ34662.1 ParA family protein [bacterium]HNS49011.1 ParA family protein [bacterium]
MGAVIYSVSNQKGGVGKTTTSLCLGAALAEQGRRVLLVDFDPQAGLTTSLGFNPDEFERTVYDLLLNGDTLKIDQVIQAVRTTGLDLVPANLDLAGAEGELIGEIGWDRTLKELLVPIQDRYDFILIDCPPSLGVLTTNALIAADRVIIPVQSEYLALKGLKQLNDIIAKVKRKANNRLRARILRTMHDTRTLHSREVVEELAKVFPEEVYRTVIKRTVRFADAALAGQSILSYAGRSEGAQAYRDLALEVLKDEETTKP